MKIGILTFHRAENFGAVFQCFALQTYLESCGHEVKVIDYRCRAIEQVYYLFNPMSLFLRFNLIFAAIDYIKRLVNYKDRLRKKKQYISFRNKYLNLTKSIHSISKDLGFDVYVVGSDQVWNVKLLHGYNKMYFCDFPVSPEAKLITYAVSSDISGVNALKDFETQIKCTLEKLNSISVRERYFAEALTMYTSKQVHVCVDPTLLIDKDIYLRMAVKPKETKYILVYHVSEIPEGSKAADVLAGETQTEIIEIHAAFAKRNDNRRHKQNLGPLEILGYIAYADYVITSSFHGLAFSLIMNKDFCVFANNNVRIANLLESIGLTDRITHSAEKIPQTSINYNLIQDNIENVLSTSKDYLSTALQK